MPSSLIDRAVDQACRSGGDAEPVPVDLLLALRAVHDPRARRGRRHDVVAVLPVAVCAVLAGARSYLAIAEWARDLTPTVRARLGMGRRPPCESTIRRALQTVDAAELDQVAATWLAARTAVGAPAVQPHQPRRVIAIDGKGARGTRPAGGRAVHLLAAYDTGAGGVLGQTIVDGKTNEISAFAPLLDRIDIGGAIITADALHTQRAHVAYLTGRGAHHLLTVKANQPTLLRQLRALPWKDIPVADVSTDKGPWPTRAAHPQTRHGQRWNRLPARRAGASDHPPQPAADRRPVAHRNGLRDHRPDCRADHRRRARRRLARALGHREPTALGPRRHLRRGPVPGQNRTRPGCHGDPAQPRHQPAAQPRRHQHRRGLPSPQQTSQPRPTHDHVTGQSTLPGPWRRSSVSVHRQLSEGRLSLLAENGVDVSVFTLATSERSSSPWDQLLPGSTAPVALAAGPGVVAVGVKTRQSRPCRSWPCQPHMAPDTARRQTDRLWRGSRFAVPVME